MGKEPSRREVRGEQLVKEARSIPEAEGSERLRAIQGVEAEEAGALYPPLPAFCSGFEIPGLGYWEQTCEAQ